MKENKKQTKKITSKDLELDELMKGIDNIKTYSNDREEEAKTAERAVKKEIYRKGYISTERY